MSMHWCAALQLYSHTQQLYSIQLVIGTKVHVHSVTAHSVTIVRYYLATVRNVIIQLGSQLLQLQLQSVQSDAIQLLPCSYKMTYNCIAIAIATICSYIQLQCSYALTLCILTTVYRHIVTMQLALTNQLLATVYTAAE